MIWVTDVRIYNPSVYVRFSELHHSFWKIVPGCLWKSGSEKRENNYFLKKLSIKDSNVFYTDIHDIYISYIYLHLQKILQKIHLLKSHKKSLNQCIRPFNKENSYQLPSNLSERTLFAVWKIMQFLSESEHRDRFHRQSPCSF